MLLKIDTFKVTVSDIDNIYRLDALTFFKTNFDLWVSLIKLIAFTFAKELQPNPARPFL